MSLCDRTKQNKIIDTNFYLVALNYQTEDKQNIMNDAKFADNGGCGFILKPDFLRDHNIDCEEKSDLWKINIKIISGHFLNGRNGSNDDISQFVKINIKGHPVDEKTLEGTYSYQYFYKQSIFDKINKTILVLGLPIYQFEIKIPSLAFIEIEVKDVSFGDLGIFCCPITMIKEKGKVKSECKAI